MTNYRSATEAGTAYAWSALSSSKSGKVTCSTGINGLPAVSLWFFALLFGYVAHAHAESVSEAERPQSSQAHEQATTQSDEPSNAFFAFIAELFGSEEPGSSEAALTALPEPESQRQPLDTSERTPSHVFQLTTEFVKELRIVRESMDVIGEPTLAQVDPGMTAAHAYLESLEVFEKVIRLQKRLGMVPPGLPTMPEGSMDMRHVYLNTLSLLSEMRRLKRQLVVDEQAQPSPFVGAKTPAQVYAQLQEASFLLDAMVGGIVTTNDVQGRVLRIRDELQLIGQHLGVKFTVGVPVVSSVMTSKEVSQQVFRATYKAIRLQSALGMLPSPKPNFSLESSTAAESYELTNFLLSEVLRVKEHLNIQQSVSARDLVTQSDSSDVFGQVLLLLRNLEAMTKAVETRHASANQ